jgi:hypothetical protein
MGCAPVEGQSESEHRGFCKIDAEALTAALIAPRHDRAGVAELLLDTAFFQFGGEVGRVVISVAFDAGRALDLRP